MNRIVLYYQTSKRLQSKKQKIEQKLLKQHKDKLIYITAVYPSNFCEDSTIRDGTEGIVYEYETCNRN